MPATLEFRFLGHLRLAVLLALQEQILAHGRRTPGAGGVILMCEHEPVVTVGRLGSRAHITRTDEEMRHDRLPVRWIKRGGGCVLHGPGQLAIYCHSTSWDGRRVSSSIASDAG